MNPEIESVIMTNEKLCLQWNDFQNIAQTSFTELRKDSDFTDVTLACEGQSIKAHKVILSSCSPFFKKLLQTQTHPQPLIYLRGLKSDDLSAMVDFIYQGETNILQEQLETFLAFAEELQLKGLDGSSKEVVPEYTKGSFSHEQRVDFIGKETTHKGRSVMGENKTGTFGRALVPMPRTKPPTIVDPETMTTIESMIERRAVGFACIKCGYTSNRMSNVKEHAEKHIAGLEYPCNSCGKVFRSSVTIRKHKSNRCQNIWKH